MDKSTCVHFRENENCILHLKCRYAKDQKCSIGGNLEKQNFNTFLKGERKTKKPIYATLARILFLSFLLYGCTGTPAIQEPEFVSSDPIFLEMIPEEHKLTVLEINQEHGFSVQLIFKLVDTESGWKKWALGKNKNGTFDQGLCQLNSGNDWKIDPWQPDQNLKTGFKYLAQMVNKFGDLETGLIAYNAGPGRVMRGQIPEVSKKYAKKILGGI